MREYFAAGLPVISTDLPEVRPYLPMARIARDSTELCAEIERLAQENVDRHEISRRMDSEGWDARYKTLRIEIDKTILAKKEITS
jgi:hypothetical protein